MNDKRNLQINLDNEKSKNDVLNLELDNKNEDLIKCMNENTALKLSLKEIPMHGSHGCFKNKNNHYRKKIQILLVIIVVEYDTSLIFVILLLEVFGFQKVPIC